MTDDVPQAPTPARTGRIGRHGDLGPVHAIPPGDLSLACVVLVQRCGEFVVHVDLLPGGNGKVPPNVAPDKAQPD